MASLEYGAEDLPVISREEKKALLKALEAKKKVHGEDFGHYRLVYYFYRLARIDGMSPEEARRAALR